MRMAPAAFSLSVIVDSYSGTQSGVTRDPLVVRMPSVARMSFGA